MVLMIQHHELFVRIEKENLSHHKTNGPLLVFINVAEFMLKLFIKN